MTSWKFCLLDVDHVMINDIPIIRLFGVTDSGKSIVVFDESIRPYFYVEPKADLQKTEKESLRDWMFKMEVEGRAPDMIEEVTRKILGKETKLFKVTGSFPSDMVNYKSLIDDRSDVRACFEHTVPFYRRYLIDKGFKPTGWFLVEGKKYKSSINSDISVYAQHIRELEDTDVPKMKVLAFSVESVQEDGEEDIAMLSIKDNRGFQRIISTHAIKIKQAERVQSERDIILRFIHIIRERNPDVIVGYDSDRTAISIMHEKSLKYGLGLIIGRDNKHVNFKTKGRIPSAYVRGRLHLDVYDFIDHTLSASIRTDILSIGNVSKELLGEDAMEMTLREKQKAWETGHDLERMAEISMREADLTLRLGSRLTPLIFEFSRITGLTPFDCCRVTYSQLVEGLIMKEAQKTNELILNRPNPQEVLIRRRADPYEGGYVHPPKKGVHENITLFDFRSLYPSIIVTFNISPDTLDCGHTECKSNVAPGEDHYFCRRRLGFIPVIVQELISKRQKMRAANCSDNDDYALKTLANAFYGYLGFASSRWYSRVCAKSAASFGRHYIRQVMETANDEGLDVIYGDTDSLFTIISTKKRAKDFLKKVNKSLPGIMEMEFKGIYKRGLFIEAQTGLAAKKKYALLDENERLVIRGLETRRRDWSSIAKDTQERVLLAVLREKSVPIALDIISETVKRLKEGKVNMNDLIIYTQLLKPLDKYEQIGPHVSVAKKLVARGLPVKVGMTISYVVTRGSGSISERAENVDDASNYDPDYYIEHQVIPAAMRVLSALDIKEEDLLKTGEQKNLSGFFSKKAQRRK